MYSCTRQKFYLMISEFFEVNNQQCVIDCRCYGSCVVVGIAILTVSPFLSSLELDILYYSGSQPVAQRPPVVRSHLPGGPNANPLIYTYFILREKMQKEKC